MPLFRIFPCAVLLLALGCWAAAVSPCPVHAGEQQDRDTPSQPAFKTEEGTRPGEWARYERTKTVMGRRRQVKTLVEIAAADGRNITSRATVINPFTGERLSQETVTPVGRTVEDRLEEILFSEMELPDDARIIKNYGRDTIAAGGHVFDCVLLSAVSWLEKETVSVKIWYSAEAPFLGVVRKETFIGGIWKKFAPICTTRLELTEWGDISRPPSP